MTKSSLYSFVGVFHVYWPTFLSRDICFLSVFISFLRLSGVRNINTLTHSRWILQRISCCVGSFGLSEGLGGQMEKVCLKCPEALTRTFGFTHTAPTETLGGSLESSVHLKAAYVNHIIINQEGIALTHPMFHYLMQICIYVFWNKNQQRYNIRCLPLTIASE